MKIHFSEDGGEWGEEDEWEWEESDEEEQKEQSEVPENPNKVTSNNSSMKMSSTGNYWIYAILKTYSSKFYKKTKLSDFAWYVLYSSKNQHFVGWALLYTRGAARDGKGGG